VIGSFAWYHWRKLKEQTIRVPESRAGIAHWVVRKFTGPSQRAVRVQMILRTETLPPPGKDGPRKHATKMLYDEDLAGHK
jgi:hypothetical protein